MWGGKILKETTQLDLFASSAQQQRGGSLACVQAAAGEHRWLRSRGRVPVKLLGSQSHEPCSHEQDGFELLQVCWE